MADRWLPSTAEPLSPRTDTGTTAMRGLSTSWSCAARWERSAPEHTASTTSLMVEPKRALSARTSAMSNSAKETARSPPTGDSNVSGAPRGMEIGPTRSSTAARARRTAVRPTSRAARTPRTGLRMKLGSASVISCACDGSRGGTQGGHGSATALPSTVRSSNLANSSAPATPSMTEWWILAMSPTMPPAMPSTTYISQGGCSGSNGRLITSATLARNSSSPPGAGRATRCRWFARSKSGSSTQRGWSNPSGTGMSRRRKGWSVGMRLSRTAATRSKLYPPGSVDGSNTQAYAISIGVSGVSE